jgi:L-arabinose transport system permease protein
MNRLKRSVLGEQGLVILFLLALAIVSVTVPNFMTQRNVLGLLRAVVTIGIVSCTMMLCLASRDVDLSVGSTVAFTGMIAVMMANHTENILLGLLAAIAAGVLVGVLIMGIAENVMNLMNIQAFYQYVARGVILLLAVLLDNLRTRAMGRR